MMTKLMVERALLLYTTTYVSCDTIGVNFNSHTHAREQLINRLKDTTDHRENS